MFWTHAHIWLVNHRSELEKAGFLSSGPAIPQWRFLDGSIIETSDQLTEFWAVPSGERANKVVRHRARVRSFWRGVWKFFGVQCSRT